MKNIFNSKNYNYNFFFHLSVLQEEEFASISKCSQRYAA